MRLVFFFSSPPVVFAVFVALPALSFAAELAGAFEATGALPAVDAGLGAMSDD